MSVKDVIKSSVYNSLGGGTGLSAVDIFIVLLAACLIGFYIFMVYKLSAKSAFYSKDLNMTFAGMPVVVAAILIAMQSNLIVSLGMVGALSIVRFRNAVKNALDLLYMFWAISAGIIVGVGLYTLALALCLIMTVMLLILGSIPNSKAPDLLVIRTKNIDCGMINKEIGTYCKYSKEKSRSIKNDETELIIELKIQNKEELLEKLAKIDGVTLINCLSHDGEYRI